MNIRRFSCFIVMVSLIFLFAPHAQGQQYLFKLAINSAITSPYGMAMEKFAKAVEAESNGKIKINVVPDQGLGTGVENVEQVRMGTVEMAILYPAFMAKHDGRFLAEELPFAWSKRWQLYAAFNGKIGDIYQQIAEKLGIKFLGMYETGYRIITNNTRPIYKPEDLKGINIRVAEVKIRVDGFKAMGANPIAISYAETFTALQLGTISGQESPFLSTMSAKFTEVQKYMSLTNHLNTTGNLSINKKLWDGLPKNYQEILERNGHKYAEYCNYLNREGEANIRQILAKAKAKTEVNEIINFEPFIKAAKHIWEKYRTTIGDEIMGLATKYTTEY